MEALISFNENRVRWRVLPDTAGPEALEDFRVLAPSLDEDVQPGTTVDVDRLQQG